MTTMEHQRSTTAVRSNKDESDDSKNNNNNKLAPFNPTNDHTLSVALEMFGFDNRNDNDDHPVLFDLGCGDGRLLIQAALRFSRLRCVGLELDPAFVARAQAAVQALNDPQVEQRIDIRQQDLCDLPLPAEEADETTAEQSAAINDVKELDLFRDATSIYLYLLPAGIQKIQPLLNAIVEQRRRERRNLSVVACTFQIHAWEPVRVENTGKSGVIKTYHYQFGFHQNGGQEEAVS